MNKEAEKFNQTEMLQKYYQNMLCNLSESMLKL